MSITYVPTAETSLLDVIVLWDDWLA